jgi:N-acetylneuraminate synthase
MLGWLCDTKGEIHISTGMTTKNETQNLVNYFIEKERNKDLVLYNCTCYPVPLKMYVFGD